MAPKITKGQYPTGKNNQPLCLGHTACRTLDKHLELTLAEAEWKVSQQKIRQIAHALMCRLLIPPTSTLTGLLGVGLSGSNFEEVTKWVARELPAVASEDIEETLQTLERRLLRTVDRRSGE